MDIEAFFSCDAVRLPRERAENDFELYLLQTFNDYIGAVKSLDSSHLGRGIKRRVRRIEKLIGWVRGAVHQSLQGQPEIAYRMIRRGVYCVDRVGNLVSRSLPANFWDQVVPDWGGRRRLYRMTVLGAGEALTKTRLFHVPYPIRHRVAGHRYGIAGFPCLYLGGSLRVCQLETGVSTRQLARAAVAEFKPTRALRLLDFGYRPRVLAPLAAQCDAHPGANIPLEQHVVNYATCWPLIAACSIKRMHDGHFTSEHIVPQILTQWLMRETMCDGIRFFSTRMNTQYNDIHQVANYVFPARALQGITKAGFSQWLINRFHMTDPCAWMRNGKANLRQEMQDTAQHLSSLPIARLA